MSEKQHQFWISAALSQGDNFSGSLCQ